MQNQMKRKNILFPDQSRLPVSSASGRAGLPSTFCRPSAGDGITDASGISLAPYPRLCVCRGKSLPRRF